MTSNRSLIPAEDVHERRFSRCTAQGRVSQVDRRRPMFGRHRRDVVLERAKKAGMRLPCDHPAAASSGDRREHHRVANMRPDVEHRITRPNQARERFGDGEIVN